MALKSRALLLPAVIAFCTVAASILTSAMLVPAAPVSTIHSSYESIAETVISPASDESNLLDINRADAAALQTLPGIGKVLAQRIIDYREMYGAFTEPEDLLEVKGIGEATLEKIRPYIVIN